ncbi:MAG: amidase family protein, partial [Xenophilus sp.]
GTAAAHGLDALVYPAARVVAPLRTQPPVSPGPDVDVGGTLFPARLAFAHNLAPASLGGWPSLVVPAGRGPASGLPVALAFDGLPGGDRALLALGAALQPLIDTAYRRPTA